MKPEDFLPLAVKAALAGGHIFPGYAASEAALESRWGESKLCAYNNLFGQKVSEHHALPYPVITIPTFEYSAKAKTKVVINAQWPVFPDWKTSFAERMALLKRLAPVYPEYQAALNSIYGEDFVRHVSKTWSTDPMRSNTVIAIHLTHHKLIDSLILAG